MAFLMYLKSICWRREEEWRTHRKSSGSDHAHRVFTDLCVCTDLEADTHDTLPVGMPVCVVEYVLTPDDATEREKHVAHLAISMRSALAIWEMHQLASTATVLGLLLDRNTVNVFVGYMAKVEFLITAQSSHLTQERRVNA